MVTINSLLSELDERTIARRIGIPHDEARMRYPLRSNVIRDFDDFSRIIGDYYNYHFAACVSRGAVLARSEATARAKELLERTHRRHNGNIVSAYNDAHDGTNGGLRTVIDQIAEGLKSESVERHIREAFDRHVAPNAWEQKVSIIRQFISQAGPILGLSIRADQPERYANDHQELIRSYVSALERTSSIFRRL